jgi:cytochrome P450
LHLTYGRGAGRGTWSASPARQCPTAHALWAALQEGLILPTGDAYKFIEDASAAEQLAAPRGDDSEPGATAPLELWEASYRFLHDRVQQTVYSLIPQERRPEVHLRIGQLMHSALGPEARDEHLFTIVGHLNSGAPLLDGQRERDDLAKLNLAAGRKAKDSAAHTAAKEYFLTGIALLGEERWERRRDLALHLHTLAVESFFLSGDFESMEHHIAQVLAHARDPLERLPGGTFLVSYLFFDALAHLALAPASPEERERTRTRVQHSLATMKVWAESAPMNYAARYTLILAEQSRVAGEAEQARARFYRAIALAQEHQLPHDEALATERFASFLNELGEREAARFFMAKARHLYVIARRPRSVLCMPILYQKKQAGILYLENELLPKAFTPERCKVLELLVAQAAISLENAKLYDTLEMKVKERTHALSEALQRLQETQKQLVAKEKLASLGSLTSGIAHEIRNPLNFVNNFSEHIVSLVAELREELEQPQKAKPATVKLLLGDVSQSAEKIREHGVRADRIIQSMLDHARSAPQSNRQMDINVVVREHVNLAMTQVASPVSPSCPAGSLMSEQRRVNLMSPEVRANPYPVYAALRRDAPVVQVDPGGLWAVSRYEDVMHIFKNPKLYSVEGLRVAADPPWIGRNPFSGSMLFVDEPKQHGRLRGPASRAFLPAALARLQPFLRATAEELATYVLDRRTVDFIEDFALPLKQWSDGIVAISASQPGDTELVALCKRTVAEMEQYIRGLCRGAALQHAERQLCMKLSESVDVERVTRLVPVRDAQAHRGDRRRGDARVRRGEHAHRLPSRDDVEQEGGGLVP